MYLYVYTFPGSTCRIGCLPNCLQNMYKIRILQCISICLQGADPDFQD